MDEFHSSEDAAAEVNCAQCVQAVHKRASERAICSRTAGHPKLFLHVVVFVYILDVCVSGTGDHRNDESKISKHVCFISFLSQKLSQRPAFG